MSAARTGLKTRRFPGVISDVPGEHVTGLSVSRGQIKLAMGTSTVGEGARQDVLRVIDFAGVSTETASAGVPQIAGPLSDYTERHGRDLLHFIWDNLSAEERQRFDTEVASAAVTALETASLIPIARFFGDWEESVSLRLDPTLAKQIARALDEAADQLPPREAE